MLNVGEIGVVTGFVSGLTVNIGFVNSAVADDTDVNVVCVKKFFVVRFCFCEGFVFESNFVDNVGAGVSVVILVVVKALNFHDAASVL